MNPIHPALAPLAHTAREKDFEGLKRALAAALENAAWLRPEHRVGDPTRYMRHVLFGDPDGAFVITAITWLPGQVSPLHGHRVWCAFGVAEGELTEEQFRESYGKLSPLKTKLYKAGDIADQDLDGKGIHRVSNRTRGAIVSLHLYGVSAERLTTGINRICADIKKGSR